MNAVSTTGPLHLHRIKTRSHVGGFKPTFGLSNESEQVPYVLKQGSPDMSCVAMTTCNREEKNNCRTFTESCKDFYVWGPRVLLQESRLKHGWNPLSLVFNSCVHREKCLWESSGSQHKNTLYSSTVFQVAEVSHLQDGVVLPGVFGVVPLQETAPRGAARASKL